MNEMNELDLSLQDKQITENTRRNYGYAYNKLLKITNKNNLSTIQQHDIIRALKEQDIPPMSKNGIISIAIHILNHYNKPTSALDKYRIKIIDEHYKNKKNDTTITDKLVSIKQLKDYTKKLYKDEKYIDFIINTIMIGYGVRNLDLDLIIVKDKSKVNETDNFIYATTKYVVVVINNYKTASSYGKKRFTIYNNQLIRSVNKLIGDNDEVKLINAVDKNAYIQSRTLNGMGEGLVFKSIISELANQNKIDEIKKLSKTRGTEVGTIFNDYHIQI